LQGSVAKSEAGQLQRRPGQQAAACTKGRERDRIRSRKGWKRKNNEKERREGLDKN
jgi:hypothetical protein